MQEGGLRPHAGPGAGGQVARVRGAVQHGPVARLQGRLGQAVDDAHQHDGRTLFVQASME